MHKDSTYIMSKKILKRESITSTETFMIGDREHDIIGAKANGIYGLGVLWGYGTRKELEASGANACITRPWELISLIKGKSNKVDGQDIRTSRK